MGLRFYTRVRFHLAQTLTREKNFFQAYLFLAHSGYHRVGPFSDTFSVTSRKLLLQPQKLAELVEMPQEQIAAAIPPDPLDPGKSWVEEIRDLLGQETDEFLSVDVSLVLDRVFGFPDGSFLPLWATCAAHSRAKKRRPTNCT